MSKLPLATPAVLESCRRSTFSSIRGSAPSTPIEAVNVAPWIFSAGHRFDVVDGPPVILDHDAIIAIADHAPSANWGHPCTVAYHDCGGALRRSVDAFFPPILTNGPEPQFFFRDPNAPTQVSKTKRAPYSPPAGTTLDATRHAILFTGLISNTRHVAGVEFAWRTLVKKYAFDPGNIDVLCFDGTINSVDGKKVGIGLWGGDNSPYEMTNPQSATKENLAKAFSKLKGSLTQDHSLFLYTSNHGNTRGLCIDESTVLTPSELGALVGQLPVFDQLVVVMGQCFSGQFCAPILNSSPAKRTVFTSAASNQQSVAGHPIDPFLQAWIAAMYGSNANNTALTTNPDTSGNGRVEVSEAFAYAKPHETLGTPVYLEKHAGDGASIGLRNM